MVPAGHGARLGVVGCRPAQDADGPFKHGEVMAGVVKSAERLALVVQEGSGLPACLLHRGQRPVEQAKRFAEVPFIVVAVVAVDEDRREVAGVAGPVRVVVRRCLQCPPAPRGRVVETALAIIVPPEEDARRGAERPVNGRRLAGQPAERVHLDNGVCHRDRLVQVPPVARLAVGVQGSPQPRFRVNGPAAPGIS